MGLTVLCAAKLHANQLERHLELIERCPLVDRIIVVRRAPVPQRLSKLENLAFGDGPVPVEAGRMLKAVRATVARERVDWVVGFNPVPWGAIAQWGALGSGVRTCLCVVGRDYQQLQAAWGWPFRAALRQATAVTVTGRLMLDGLVRLGVSEDRLRILPHSVDLERFAPSDEPPRFDVISVGQLIPRKRMDVLIEATRLLKERGLRLRLGILGRGPEEPRLRELVATGGLEEQVEFLGYRDDVETVLRRARVFALLSEWEGVPFALMEAMAAGVVPVVTPVGTIEDWVESGRNGVIVPTGDAAETARRLADLLQPGSEEWTRKRSQLLAERQRLSFTAGVGVWNDIFSRA